jgi:predicted aldo/keto reductase-like oxidoreductase
VWNHEEVTVVLSGMTNSKITRENMNAASNFAPLTEKELSVFSDVIDIFQKAFKIKCTGCNYCLPCHKDINIPARFAAYNASYAQNFFTGAMMYYTGMGVFSRNPVSVHSCDACGRCEKACSQNIEIRKELKKVAGRLESLPFRILVKIAKFFLR